MKMSGRVAKLVEIAERVAPGSDLPSLQAAKSSGGVVTFTGASHSLANSEPRSGRDAGGLPSGAAAAGALQESYKVFHDDLLQRPARLANNHRVSSPFARALR